MTNATTLRARYRGKKLVTAVVMPHVLLIVALGVALVAKGVLAIALGVAIPIVLLWEVVTLHFPHAIEIDDRSLVVRAYGRTHRFARDEVQVHVRRFLVKDRVLVRVTPAPPWKGKYWLLDVMEGFEGVVKALEGK